MSTIKLIIANDGKNACGECVSVMLYDGQSCKAVTLEPEHSTEVELSASATLVIRHHTPVDPERDGADKKDVEP